MIDEKGYRANVGIIVSNPMGQVLWARRIGKANAWQFPQGGIQEGEDLEQALYRELHEEVGLYPKDVRILDVTSGWLRYRLPHHFVRGHQIPVCIGQKQKWFLLELISGDENISLSRSSLAEFTDWRWVSYWYPVNQVIDFKREVYLRALKALSPAHSELERRFSNQSVSTESL